MVLLYNQIEPQFQALHEHVPDLHALAHLLRFLVVKHDERFYSAVRWSPLGPPVFAEWTLVMHAEITRTVHAIAAVRHHPTLLKSVCPALASCVARWGKQADIALARTARQLVWLEDLLIPNVAEVQEHGGSGAEVNGNEPWKTWRQNLNKAAREVRALDGFGRVLDRLTLADTANLKHLEVLPDWYLAPPLLVAEAVKLSHVEFLASSYWEESSSLRAADELRRVLGDLMRHENFKGPLAAAVNFAATIVAGQSAFGQLARGSGDDRFLQALESTFPNESWRDMARSGLLLAGVLEVARRRFPGTQADTALPIGLRNSDQLPPEHKVLLNSAETRQWEHVDWYSLVDVPTTKIVPGSEPLSGPALRVYRNGSEFRQLLAELFPQATESQLEQLVKQAARSRLRDVKLLLRASENPTPAVGETWAYFSGLRLQDSELDKFRERVRAQAQQQGFQPMSFYLRRELLDVLNDLTAECARAVGDGRDLCDYFRLSPRKTSGSEQTGLRMELLLHPRLAARKLLFPNKSAADVRAEWDSLDTKPGDTDSTALMEELFEAAKEEFGLGADRLGGRLYVPYPLFARLLSIVARLCPDSTQVIEIVYDEHDHDGGLPTREVVEVPKTMPAQHPLVALIARFVNATVVNRAVSTGYRTCDIVVDKPASLKGVDWNAAIVKDQKECDIPVLADVYVRGYNTQRRAIGVVPPQAASVLQPPAVSNLAALLPQLFQSQDDAQVRPLVVGIDIGATLVKFQLFSIVVATDRSQADLQAVGHSFSIPTPQPRARDEKQRGVKRSGKDPKDLQGDLAFFALALPRAIREAIQGDPDLRKKVTADGAPELIGVGVTWPGPVRNNLVTGTSFLLSQFGIYSPAIRDNKIEEILEFDLLSAIAEAFSDLKEFLPQHARPFVALVNDADADGYAEMLRSRDNVGGKRLFLKPGSGTATSVFSFGRIVAGLCEGGKMMLDLAAPPPKQPFPPGLANMFVSKKLLPAVARRLADDWNSKHPGEQFSVLNLDSQELGMFLDADASKEKFKGLCAELGLRDLGKDMRSPDGDAVDPEILRGVYERGMKSGLPARRIVERFLCMAGRDAVIKFNDTVQHRGMTRLSEILSCDADLAYRFFHGVDTDLRDRLVTFKREIAVPAVEALGRYLGDYIVQFHDLYEDKESPMDTTISLGGGVLSGQTREIAVRHARQRVRRYDIELEVQNERLFLFRSPATGAGDEPTGAATLVSKDDRQSGPLGAAVFALIRYVYDMKRAGIAEIRNLVSKMQADATATLNDQAMTFEFPNVTPNPEVRLSKYSLSAAEVREFLDQSAATLHVLRADGSEGSRYQRWVDQHSA
jgi:hypothetical protein